MRSCATKSPRSGKKEKTTTRRCARRRRPSCAKSRCPTSAASVRSILGVLLLALCPAALAQQIELLYVGAADCGFCRRWEAQYLEHRKPRASLDWSAVRFTMVDIGTFRSRFSADDAPAHLRPGMARAMEAAGRSSLRGTPWFALFVDGEVRVQAFGTDGFEMRIQPAMRAALHEKKAPGTRT